MFLYLLSFSLLVIFYFGFSIPVTATLFIPQGALLLLGVITLHRRPDWRVVGLVFLTTLALLGWVIALSDRQLVDISRRLLSGGQLVYILLVCTIVATSRPLEPKAAKTVARLCWVMAAVMLTLGILEIFTPLKIVSDVFREIVYPGLVYASDVRDFGLAGFVRPKAFASEPSQAAWGISMLLLSSVAFYPTKRSFGIALGLLTVTTFVFFSPNAPIAALFLSMVAMVLFWDSRRIASTGAVLALVSLVGVTVSLFLLTNMVSGRVDAYSGYETSFYIRVIQPLSLAGAALEHDWVVGVGFAGLESIWDKISVIEGGAGVENLNRTPGMALFTIPLFTGVSGIILFVLLIVAIMKREGRRVGLAICSVLVFALLQKQSFVISSAWVIAAVWAMQLKASVKAVQQESAFKQAGSRRLDS